MSDRTVSIIFFVLGILLILFGIYEIVGHSVYSDQNALSMAFYPLLGIVFIILGYNKYKENQTNSKKK